MRSHRSRRARLARLARLLLAMAMASLGGGLGLLEAGATSRPAVAAVVHRVGFEATVLGWTSWYGSYDLGPLGAGWCIDHGLRAPDPALDYRPTAPTDLDAATQAAMARAVTTIGGGTGATDAVDAAALMLVLHDLRGAIYPFGRLDVDTLATSQLSGFAGHEGDIVAQARAIKADALAHGGLRGPVRLTIALTPTTPTTGAVTFSLTAAGAPMAGVAVHVNASGATLAEPSGTTTGPDGTVHATYQRAASSVVTVAATAVAADPTLHAFAPMAAPAQRIVIPAWATAQATATEAPVPTTTTSTSTTSTSTTSTSTTSSTTSTTSTSTSTTSTASTTSTTATPSTSAPTTAPTSVPTTTPTTVAMATLPRTGAPTQAWALIGAGLVLLGGALAAMGRGATLPDS